VVSPLALSLADYLNLVGLSAIVGVGVSTILNYFITLKLSKTQARIKTVEEKLGLYSYIIFNLDKMRFKGSALKKRAGDTSNGDVYSYSDNELENMVSTINDKIGDRYYLFEQDILQEWISIITLPSAEETKERVQSLRQMLVDQYNKTIIPEYNNLTGKNLQVRK
jgi:hypothetical protein